MEISKEELIENMLPLMLEMGMEIRGYDLKDPNIYLNGNVNGELKEAPMILYQSLCDVITTSISEMYDDIEEKRLELDDDNERCDDDESEPLFGRDDIYEDLLS